MNPLNRRNVKRSKAVIDLSSLLNYSLQPSGDTHVPKKPVLNAKETASESNNKKFNQGFFQRQLHGKKLVDANSLNRDTMTPNTIIITRTNLIGHGEVPLVESMGMGPVMYCQLVIQDGDVKVVALIATKDSVTVNNPKFADFIQPKIKRLEVEAEGRIPLIDHDFDSAAEIKINGESVESIFVDGGVNMTKDSYESTLPSLIAKFKDRPSITEYKVGYIRLECKPTGKKGKYYQVFQCPGHH